MGSVSLIALAHAGAAGTGGLIAKVTPSPMCLGLGSRWPPSPHRAFRLHLLVARALYMTAQDSQMRVSEVARGSGRASLTAKSHMSPLLHAMGQAFTKGRPDSREDELDYPSSSLRQKAMGYNGADCETPLGHKSVW